MSKELELGLKLTLKGDKIVSTSLAETEKKLNKIGHAGDAAFAKIRNSASRLNAELNGFSGISKIAAAFGGLQLIRDTLNKNLNFDRDLLEMKHNAGMTIKQVAELRQLALDSAHDSLQSPAEIMSGMKAFARAGEKFEDIKIKTVEAAKAATVFRTNAEAISNMDFDITSKFKVAPDRLNAIHNMLYYHGNAGRMEAGAMAKEAPVLLNAAADVGIGGEKGLNFMGALSQVLMNKAVVDQPSMVSTLAQQGLGHLPMYAKGLGKAGINLKTFMPSGKFRGEGGVEGILAFADMLDKKGFSNLFTMQKAGINDQEARKFLMALIQNKDQIRKEMENASLAAKEGLMATHLAEMQNSSFGKIRGAEISAEKLQLNPAMDKAADKVADGARFLDKHADTIADHPLATIGGVAGTALAGRWALLKGAPRLAMGALQMGMSNLPALGHLGGVTSLEGITAMGGSAVATAGAGALVAGGIGGGIGYGINRLSQGTWAEKAIDAIAVPIARVLEKFMDQPVRVEVAMKIDQNGMARVDGLRTSNPAQKINVDAGLIMPGATR